MRTSTRLVPALLSALVLPVLAACDAAPVSRPASAAVVAGVPYEPGAPLDARLTPLGGQGLRTYNVHYRGARGGDVPGLLVLPAAATPRRPVPCLLLLHGLGGSKGNMLLPALVFARRGYAVFAIDIAGHGERRGVDGGDPNAFGLARMRTAMAQTIVDLRRGVDFLETRREIDRRRIGFVGISLGGILGGVFAAEEPRVRAVALWSAGGDWGRLVTESAHRFARQMRDEGGPRDAEAIRREMAAVDPARVADHIAPRPLLMLNGRDDAIVPVACARALYAAARQPKRLVLLPGGHIPDLYAMMDRTLTWLDENLKGRASLSRL